MATRYTRAELDEQARDMARERKGSVVDWELIIPGEQGGHTSLYVTIRIRKTKEVTHANCAI